MKVFSHSSTPALTVSHFDSSDVSPRPFDDGRSFYIHEVSEEAGGIVDDIRLESSWLRKLHFFIVINGRYLTSYGVYHTLTACRTVLE